ncbi:MAG: cystathionine beta-lyase [Burkholderiales bacterium]|nr:cystathionine beta-lyase [Burkholderiales bacterium]
MHDDTRTVHAGRHPQRHHGMVNPPVYHASTVLCASMAEWERKRRDWVEEAPGVYHYGRHGTPTTEALQEAVAELEGGYRTLIYPSGLAACAGAILSCVCAGDHLLVTDSVYGPTRSFASRFLARFGVETTFFDPLVGAGIEALFRPNTRAVYLESPGSLTLEVQDVPAIATLARARGARVIIDNTWATPLYFKPFRHGVDFSVHSGTKYVVGHSDALMGLVTVGRDAWPLLKATTFGLGQTAGPDDVYLAQRGLRTLAVRMRQHWTSGLVLADWFARQPEVERVIHPARPQDPGNALWKRDFLGACGLFSVLLKPVPQAAFAAFVDALALFGIGASWGGYESLIVPFDLTEIRTATRWEHPGQCFRIHAGLEDAGDLCRDLESGFEAMRARVRTLGAAPAGG